MLARAVATAHTGYVAFVVLSGSLLGCGPGNACDSGICVGVVLYLWQSLRAPKT